MPSTPGLRSWGCERRHAEIAASRTWVGIASYQAGPGRGTPADLPICVTTPGWIIRSELHIKGGALRPEARTVAVTGIRAAPHSRWTPPGREWSGASCVP